MSTFAGMLSLGNNAGVLQLNNTGNANTGSAAAAFDLGTGSASLGNRNGGITIDFGALSGSGGTILYGRLSGTGATSTTYSVGALNTDSTFAGSIRNGGDSNGVRILKVGNGTLTLTGSSGHTGTTTVASGTLSLTGTLSSSAVIVSQGGTFALNNGGRAGGAVTVQANGILVLTSGSSVIGGTFTNASGGNVVANNGGSLTFGGGATNNGTMRFTGGSALATTGTFVNNGILDIMTGAQTLPANFVNNGTVIDASAVKPQSYSMSDTGFSVAIQSYSGHKYGMQRADSLASPVWQPVPQAPGNATTLAGTGGVLTFTDPAGAAGSKRFYRITVSP
jgi:autotransporter-associated beta strand protein